MQCEPLQPGQVGPEAGSGHAHVLGLVQTVVRFCSRSSLMARWAAFELKVWQELYLSAASPPECCCASTFRYMREPTNPAKLSGDALMVHTHCL